MLARASGLRRAKCPNYRNATDDYAIGHAGMRRNAFAFYKRAKSWMIKRTGMISDLRLFFDHIPKTAGTSIWTWLVEAFGKENVSPQLKGLKVESALSLYGDRFALCGHFGFVPGDKLPPGYISATVLRDPRERALSEYFFLVEVVPPSDMSAEERLIKTLPIEEAFSRDKFFPKFQNVQASHLASRFHPRPQDLPPEDLIRFAKLGLEQFDLVGTTERLGEFVDVFSRLFDIPQIVLRRVNVTSRRQGFKDLPVGLRRKIEIFNEVDLELWKFADTLFAGRTVIFSLPEAKDSSEEAKAPDHSAIPDTIVEDGALELLGVSVSGQVRQTGDLLAGELATLSIALRAKENVDDLNVGFSIDHDSGLRLFGINTWLLGYSMKCRAGGDYKIDFAFAVDLGIGTYRISIAAHSGPSHFDSCHLLRKDVVEFHVTGYLGARFEGLTRLIPQFYASVVGGEGTIASVSIMSEEDIVQRIGFMTPEITDASGFMELLGAIPSLRPGEQLAVAVDIFNMSAQDWVGDGSRPVSLSYHWRRMDGEPVIFDGLRSPFSDRIVKAAGKSRGNVLLQAPESPGRYALELSLVQETVCWLEERGFKSAMQMVDVGGEGQCS